MSNPTSDEKNSSVTGATGGTEAAGEPNAKTGVADAESGESLLAQLQGDLERFRDLALRSQADFENFRKRAAREKEEAVKYANAGLLERLIPILDNFELGLTAAKGASDANAVVLGFEMVARQLNDFLTQSGVEPVSAEGQKFDPNLHEAFAQEESAQVAEGGVIRQLRKGFKLKDRLLRPAAVVVSKGAPAVKA
jgi:molecular chaperone GrpE